jgi:hypothetical protein
MKSRYSQNIPREKKKKKKKKKKRKKFIRPQL